MTFADTNVVLPDNVGLNHLLLAAIVLLIVGVGVGGVWQARQAISQIRGAVRNIDPTAGLPPNRDGSGTLSIGDLVLETRDATVRLEARVDRQGRAIDEQARSLRTVAADLTSHMAAEERRAAAEEPRREAHRLAIEAMVAAALAAATEARAAAQSVTVVDRPTNLEGTPNEFLES